MSIILFILIIGIISKTKVIPIIKQDSSYISLDNSNVIKGIFVLLVFMSHSFNAFSDTGKYDYLYSKFQIHIGQLVVAMFLFYSGYGLMYSVMNKGGEYIKGFANKHIIKLLLRFDIIVIFFYLLDTVLGERPATALFLKALIGWESIGNSNWYIFVILLLYTIFFISFLPLLKKNTHRSRMISLIICTLCSIIAIVVLVAVDRPKWFYNTIPSFVFGLWFASFQKIIDKVVMSSKVGYSLLICILTGIYTITYFRRASFIMYPIWEFSFVTILVLVTMIIRIESRVLKWFGMHVFPFYMLQKIPVVIMSHYRINVDHPYSFTIISFVVTILLVLLYDAITDKSFMRIISRRSIQ